MINIFNKIFPEKNDNYNKAINGLKNIKKKFDGFVITFPDVTPNEIIFIKEKWETLPNSISKGVKIMALSFVNDCKTLITKYDPNAYIIPHKHGDEYEHGLIIKGTLIDKFTGKEYHIGDSYCIKPNQIHYLSSNNEGCVVHSTLSSKPIHNFETLPNEIISKL